MDLSDTSRKRVISDLDVARRRIVDLSLAITSASSELMALRAKLEAHQFRSGVSVDKEQRNELQEYQRDTGAHTSPRMHGGAEVSGLRQFLASLGRGKWGAKTRHAERMLYHVDEICGQRVSPMNGSFHITVSRRSAGVFTISGWVVPPGGKGVPYSTVQLVLNAGGDPVVFHVPTHMRDDVGTHFGDVTLATSGFRFSVAMSELVAGTHQVELIAVNPERGESRAHIGEVEIV